MTAQAHAPLGANELGVRALALTGIIALAMFVSRLDAAPYPYAWSIAALGLLLLGGDLFSLLVDRFGLPHLTGYLLAGMVLGPSGIAIVDKSTIHGLSLINALALGLIALSAGSELTLALLRSAYRTLAFSVVTQVLITLPIISLGFFLLRPFLDFAASLSLAGAIGLSVVWGVLGVSRSPSATLAVIAQVRPAGPLTNATLAIIVAFDVLVLLLFAFAISLAQSLLVPDTALDLSTIADIGHELLATCTFGVTLGLVIAAYLAFIGRAVVFFVVTLCYGVALVSQMLHYDALLIFVVAGFIVANTTRYGRTLMANLAQGGRLVYVLFFALAGAKLDTAVIARLWPAALALCALRIAATFVAAKAGSALAKDPPPVSRYGWMPLVSQAGVTIGMSLVVAEAFPTFGADMQALAIACVAVNELVGPPLFKLALDRTGESGRASA